MKPQILLSRILSRLPGRLGMWLRGAPVHGRALTRIEMRQGMIDAE